MKKIILLLCMLLFLKKIDAQWQQCYSLFGGRVNCLEKNGTDIFAGTNAGIFFSSNKGSMWSSLGNGLANFEIHSIAISGVKVYAGTNQGLFLSSDYGYTWASISNSLTINRKISAILVKDSILVIGAQGITGSGSVFRSNNDGASWTQPFGNFTAINIYDFAIKDSSFYTSTGNGVYKSNDNGINWATINNGLPPNWDFFALEIVGQNIYTATWGSGIYKSINNGQSWVSASNNAPSFIYSMTSRDSIIYIGSNGYGVYRTTSSSNYWTPINNGLTSQFVYALASIDSTILVGIPGQGINKTTDTSDPWYISWSIANNGLICTNINALTSSSNNLIATSDNGNYISFTNPNSWAPINDLPYSIASLSSNGNNITAGTNGAGIYFSSNNGNNWNSINNGISSSTQVSAVCMDGLNIYAGVNTNLKYSNDLGNTWSNIYSICQSCYAGFSALGVDSTNVFAGTSFGSIRTTTNNINWSSDNINYNAIKCFYKYGQKVFAATQNGLYSTVNNGTSWNLVNNISINSITSNINTLFAGTNNGVFLSSDSGVTWQAINNGLMNKRINKIEIKGTEIYAGTSGSGVWRQQLSTLSAIVEKTTESSLIKIYPNPAENNLTISNIENIVTISFYDLLGKRILVEKIENNSSIDISILKQGIYAITLESEKEKTYFKLVVSR